MEGDKITSAGNIIATKHHQQELLLVSCRLGDSDRDLFDSDSGFQQANCHILKDCDCDYDVIGDNNNDDKKKSTSTRRRLMTNLRGRLRKARKRISGCHFPLTRRSRKCSIDDVYYSVADYDENSNGDHSSGSSRSPNDVGQSCRGSINLQEARILSDKLTHNLVISASSQTFHLKAQNDIDRQQWLSALEYSRHKAIKLAESEEDEDAHLVGGESRSDALLVSHQALVKKLEDLATTAKMLDRHGEELIKCVNEPDIDKKTLSERAGLLKITASAVLKAAEEFVELSDRGARRLGKVVQSEKREKLMLHEQLEALAKQHSSLERAATISTSHPPLSAYSDQEDEFHDAAEELSISGNNSNRSHSGSGDSNEFKTPAETLANNHQMVATSSESSSLAPSSSSSTGSGRVRRSQIPARPDLPLNLWSIMKNCIGKELSKIPMPVNFSEPLSVLQRVTEDLEYANLLEQAATKDPLIQMCYVAAYAVSNYSTTGNRTNKPFNPLLGETFECDRSADLGWKSIAEQVSHHPPAAAHHAEGKGWVMFQDFTMTSRFRGKYLSVIPVGYTHVHFPETGDMYSYKKVTTTVHNIIVGKLWIDNHGEMDIINHRTGDKCCLRFIPYSYFSKETPRKIYGIVKDSNGDAKYVVQGTWDKCVDMMKVVSSQGKGDKMKVETDANPIRLWTCNPPHPGSEKMHNFTRFAIELNEPEEGVAPTDTRLRPDQRLMEDGRWDESNKKKLEVEEKQRVVRRKREAEMEKAMAQGREYEEYTPTWFTRTQDELTGALIHKFNGDYWKYRERGDWSKCPDIYI